MEILQVVSVCRNIKSFVCLQNKQRVREEQGGEDRDRPGEGRGGEQSGARGGEHQDLPAAHAEDARQGQPADRDQPQHAGNHTISAILVKSAYY